MRRLRAAGRRNGGGERLMLLLLLLLLQQRRGVDRVRPKRERLLRSLACGACMRMQVSARALGHGGACHAQRVPEDAKQEHFGRRKRRKTKQHALARPLIAHGCVIVCSAS